MNVYWLFINLLQIGLLVFGQAFEVSYFRCNVAGLTFSHSHFVETLAMTTPEEDFLATWASTSLADRVSSIVAGYHFGHFRASFVKVEW